MEFPNSALYYLSKQIRNRRKKKSFNQQNNGTNKVKRNNSRYNQHRSIQNLYIKKFDLKEIKHTLSIEPNYINIIPYSVNSVHYKINIKEHVCCLCKQYNNSNNIRVIKCKSCFHHLGKSKPCRLCSSCVISTNVCISAKTSCVYTSCIICNQSKSMHLNNAEFTMYLIKCNSCKAYMKRRMNQISKCYMCSSCAASHNLCINASTTCEYAHCIVCKYNDLWRKPTFEECTTCHHIFCDQSKSKLCGIDNKCKKCLVKEEEKSMLKIIRYEMKDIFCDDINQIIFGFALGFSVKCGHEHSNKIYINNVTELLMGIDAAGKKLTYYFIDPLLYNARNDYNDRITRINGQYARVFHWKCLDGQQCGDNNCNNYEEALYFRRRLKSGPFQFESVCWNHPSCFGCGRFEKHKRNLHCNICEMFLCHLCIGYYKHKKILFEQLKNTGKCKSCFDTYQKQFYLDLLESLLLKQLHDVCIIKCICEYTQKYAVECAECKDMVIFDNDTIENQREYIRNISRYSNNKQHSSYYYFIRSKCVNKKQLKAKEYSYIDNVGVYIRAFCVNCTHHIEYQETECQVPDCKNLCWCYLQPVVGKTYNKLICKWHCMDHRIEKLRCGQCKKTIILDRDQVDLFVHTQTCNICEELLCYQCETGCYCCWNEKSHAQCESETIEKMMNLRMPTIQYKYIHEKKKENHGSISKRKRTKNKIKNKSYWQRRNDKRKNVLSLKKWNKRYLLSVNGF